MRFRATEMIGFLLIAACGFPISGWSQDSVAEDDGYETSIRLINSEHIVEMGADVDVFGEEMKAVMEVADAEVDKLGGKEDQAVVIRFAVYPDKDFEVKAFSRPEIDEEKLDKLLAAVRKTKISRSKLLTMRFQIEYERGTPPIEEGEVWPAGSVPEYVLRAEAYEKATPAGKIAILQKWAREEVLPILGAYQRKADPKFGGVVGVGKMLEKADLDKPLDVSKLIDNNSDYWRGMLEMGSGNPLVTATRIFMEVTNGNLGEASRFAGLHRNFLDKETIPSQYINEFIDLHQDLRKEINPMIGAAIKDFDGGDFKGAIAKCEAILKIDPRDPWTRYELWFSQQQLALSTEPPGKHQSWNEAAKEIYAMDSMYPIAASASNEREGFQLLRRIELKEMAPPTNREEFQEAIVKQADIAADLAVHHYAAEAYWLIFKHFPKEIYGERDLMDYSLYSIDSAGGKGIIGMLDADRDKIVEAIEKWKKERYEGSATFGKFKKKG